jgi:hypothetical protein
VTPFLSGLRYKTFISGFYAVKNGRKSLGGFDTIAISQFTSIQVKNQRRLSDNSQYLRAFHEHIRRQLR